VDYDFEMRPDLTASSPHARSSSFRILPQAGARNLKTYGELLETPKINEADTFPTHGDKEISFDFDIEDVCFRESLLTV
jgi:hypothetical protein